MHSEHPIYMRSLASLQAQARKDVDICRDGLIRWVQAVRPAEGPGGRFNWAIEYNDDMPANITSTSYCVQALDRAGILDEIVSEHDKKEGIAWLESMKQPCGNYVDPVYDKVPEEPADGFSDGNFHRVINCYAEEILQLYGADVKEIQEACPPPSWPQLETADRAADWITNRTWEYDTWRSGDISASMIYFLYQWYLADKIDLAPLANALKVIYDMQDKQTGLWSNRSKSNCSLQNMINGTFKLMMVISKDLELPIFHAEKIVDTLIDHMTGETYVGSRSGCDELDNILTLAVGSRNCDNYRQDEVQKIAAWQISLMKELYHRNDGGLSFYPDYGQHNWVGFEITPITLQGDAMGAGVHSLAFSIAIELAGIEEKVKWQNKWRQTWQKNRFDGAEKKLGELRDHLSDILDASVKQRQKKLVNREHPIYERSLESLQEQAIADINIIRDGFVGWAEKLRPAEGPKGRFNWAVKYNPDLPANVASTGYAIVAFARAGILEYALSEEDKKEGIAWIRSMKQPGGMFFDPAFDRDPEDPGDLDGFKEAVNRYAECLLADYGEKAAEIEMRPPPENWPQIETADTGANWIKMRTWEYDTWRAGATSEKVIYFLYQWYLKGLIGIEPLADALREVYSLQDPKTGLWATRSKSNCTLQNRINGSFKLLMVLSKDISLPMLHGEKVVDTLIEHMTSDYYKGSRSGCDELDNILVLTVGSLNCGDYRFDEVQKLAAYSISLIKELYHRDDGGLSFYSDYCQHNWLGHAVAPIILQGDVMGAGVHTLGISVAADIADLKDKIKWVVNWRDDWRSSRGEDAQRKTEKLRDELSDILSNTVSV